MRYKNNNKELLETLTEEQWAYLAGVIDSSVTNFPGIISRGPYFTFRYSFALSVHDSIYIHNLANLLHHQYLTKNKAFSHAFAISRKSTFSFFIKDTCTKLVLEKIIPYLEIFKEEAKIALKFRETFERGSSLSYDDKIIIRTMLQEELNVIRNKNE